MALCMEFQKDIDKGSENVLRALLSEKEYLQNEMLMLDEKNNALKNSMMAFVEGILEDLNSGNSGKFIFCLCLYVHSKMDFLVLEFNSTTACLLCEQVFCQ